MNEIFELQKLLGKIYDGQANLAPELKKYRYMYKEDFSLRFLYVLTRMLYRIVTAPPNPKVKRPDGISKESLVWLIKGYTYMSKLEMDAIVSKLNQCVFISTYNPENGREE